MTLVLILTNCPDAATADAIADALIEARLAACANRYPPIESRYRWKGRIETETEHPLILKTRPDLAERAMAEIRRLHPFETPAILRLQADATPGYLDWIAAETGS